MCEQDGVVEVTSFPRTIDEITPEWLTETLRESGAIANAKVESIELANLEGGIVGEVNRVKLTYDRHEVGAPGTVVAKLANADDRLRKGRDRVGLYEREVRVYRELASVGSGIRLPALYFADYDGATSYATILMEDLGQLRAVKPTEGCSTEDVGAALKYLARLHSIWWEDQRPTGYSWMSGFDDDVSGEEDQEAFIQVLELFLERVGDQLPPGVQEIARKLAPRLADVRSRLACGPVTMIHGDFHLGNLFFDDAESGADSIVPIDWQTARPSRPAADVGVLLLTSLLPAKRREYENRLLAGYFRDLTERGVGDYKYEEFLIDYRLALLNRFALIARTFVALSRGTPDEEPKPAGLFGPFQALVD